jgi:hypothetical protein
MAISITDPIGRAISRSKFITFQPFNIGKWFTLGFVAFLAMFDEGGGGNFNFRMPGGGFRTRPPMPPPTRPTSGPIGFYSSTSSEDFDQVWNWITSHIAQAVLIGIAILAIVIAIWVLIIWITSRGKFMFLEGIAQNTAEVVAPWKRYRPLGNSLFKFRAAFAALSFCVMMLICLVVLLVAMPDIRGRRFGSNAIAALVIGLVLFLPAGIFLGLIELVTRNFVTHIMYATGQPVMAAWGEFRQSVLPGNHGKFILFFLMQVLLAIAVGIMQALIGCATCCIGLLPYLSSVIALPLLVFTRAYPIYFLQQFSPRYEIIVEPPPNVGFAVIPLAGQGYPPPGSLPPPQLGPGPVGPPMPPPGY